MSDLKKLEALLDDRDLDTRRGALKELKKLADAGKVEVQPARPFTNLHCHTFYSFNAYGYSPQHVAWVAFTLGLEMVGKVDFDTLDGTEEFLETESILGTKAVAGFETRVFVPEYSHTDINSPGENGVAYFCGSGFSRRPEKGSKAERILRKVADIARKRNIAIVEKLRGHLAPVGIDYDKDILPLTISGTATERHILRAWYEKSQREIKGEGERAEFWSKRLNLPVERVQELFKDEYGLFEKMRSVLVKRGGVGYVDPDPSSFPTLDEVVEMIEGSGALPCYAWLDGTSGGELDAEETVQYYLDHGIRVFNVIPDRNWDIKDPKTKADKVARLNTFMQVLRDRKLPAIAGTEMNKLGQRLVDDFDAPELKPHVDDFRKGAHFVYNHAKEGR